MFALIKLAFRNLARHKKRSLLTGAMISIGAIMALLAYSFSDTVSGNMTEAAIKACAGNIQIHGITTEKIDDFYPAPDEAPLLTESDRLTALVAQEPIVEAVAPRLRFGGLMALGEDEPKYGIITAIDPSLEPRITSRLKVVEGTYLCGTDGILLGKATAEALHAEIGQEITIMAANPDGMINGFPFRVEGIVTHQGIDMFLDYMNYIDITTARQLLYLNANDAFELALTLKDGYREEAALQSLKTVLSGAGYQVQVDPWWKVMGIYYGIVAGAKVIPQVMLFILLFVIAFGIINTVIMAVLERTREIGMMLALGTKQREIRGLFLLEMGLLGIMAAGIGIVVGTGLILWLGKAGIPVSIEAMQYYLGGKRFYFTLNIFGVLASFLGIVLVSLLAAYFPARMVGKLKPVEALRQN